jgi:hypothetical protein
LYFWLSFSSINCYNIQIVKANALFVLEPWQQ